MAGQGPGRPPNINDLVRNTNGSPQYLGSLVSTGAAVNNLTTATPFNATPLGAASVATPAAAASLANLTNTLAGKTLIVQTTAAGLIMAATNSSMTANQTTPFLVAQQSVMPPAAGTAPGFLINGGNGDARILVMQPTEGWLQWLPVTGSANLHVWELV